jgi:hypothetical protein
MRSSRKDEQGSHPPFRSKRLYGANAHWYFDAREGMQSGPFSNQDEARKALAMFVAQNVFAGTGQGFSHDDRPGAQDGIEHMVQEVIDILRCHTDFGPLAANTWVLSRLEDLELNGENNPTACERRGVLTYAMKRNIGDSK